MAWLDYKSKFGSAGTGDGQFATSAGAYGVAADDTYIYVCDRGNKRVQVFLKSDNSYHAQFSVGSAAWELPMGIAVDGSYIYVARNDAVKIYNKSTYAYVADLIGTISGAYYIAVDASYVYIHYSDYVQRYNKSTRTYVDQFGGFGSGNGQFNMIAGIAVDSNYIYVGDSLNDRVQIFDITSLAYVNKFGSSGSGNGQFGDIKDVAVDSTYIYVVDVTLNRFQVFLKNSPFTFVAKKGTTGSGNGELNGPQRISLYGSDLYIGDTGNNRVQIFDNLYYTPTLQLSAFNQSYIIDVFTLNNSRLNAKWLLHPLPDLIIPIEAFSGRLKDGEPTYLSVNVPNGKIWADDLAQRMDNEIVIIREGIMSDGSVDSREIVRVNLEDVRLDRGARNSTVSLTGHKTVTTEEVKRVALDGVSYRGEYDGKRHIRCRFDSNIRPGWTACFGDEEFTVGEISYRVGKNSAEMEVVEA